MGKYWHMDIETDMLEPSCTYVQKWLLKIQAFSGQFLNHGGLEWTMGECVFIP